MNIGKRILKILGFLLLFILVMAAYVGVTWYYQFKIKPEQELKAFTGDHIDYPFVDGRFQIHRGGTGQLGLVITTNGDIGIGTRSPQGKLDVNGAIYQRGGQLHADYVFEPDFKLESIREHADFMFENKHLKGIPKATVDEKGREIVEVGAHRKGIVEELEKAHIYIYQLEERISKLEVLEAENKALGVRLAKLESMLNERQ